MASTRFLCQRCGHALQCIQRPGPAHPEPSTEMAASAKRQVETSRRPFPDCDSHPPENASNFVLLGEIVSLKSLSSIQNTEADMLDILSGQKPLDHPLCDECMDGLLAKVDAQLSLAQRDTETYRRCLQSRSGVQGDEEERRALHAELRALEVEEARLAHVLKVMGQDEARVAEELRASQAETEQLCEQEREFQKEYCALKLQQLELLDSVSSVKNQLRSAQRQLAHLQRTSIFDATFAIWEDGPLGVINNFRLGRLPGVLVGWYEINSAWGQTTLLLLALARTAGLRFQRFQPVACGHRSHLRSMTGEPAVLPLFSDGKQNVFFNNTFDLGMMAFLDCLQQFAEEAGKGEQGLCLPHRIHVQEGELEEAGAGRRCSIRTHLNTHEQWTQALRLMLVNLKWSLSWASVRYCRN